MLERVLEPEVMDTPEEARAYDAMDHGAVNASFCDDVVRFATRDGRSALGTTIPCVIDFGTGTALIPIGLCERIAGFSVVAVDMAENMLALARVNVARAGLADRIVIERVDAKSTPYADGSFAGTISNSIVHHIPEPQRCFAEMWRVTAPRGMLFVRDLHRPQSEGELERLVGLHTGARPTELARAASFDTQRELLRGSLAAALTISEVVALVETLGIPASAVTMTSDRHWTLAYEKP